MSIPTPACLCLFGCVSVCVIKATNRTLHGVTRTGSWRALVSGSKKDVTGEKGGKAQEAQRLLDAEELVKEQGEEYIRDKVSLEFLIAKRKAKREGTVLNTSTCQAV